MTSRCPCILPLLLIGLTAACGPTASSSPQPIDKATAPVINSAHQTGADASLPPIIPLYPPLATSATPAQPVKYLPNCPGMSTPNRRVVGSNCFGILPAECGADLAKSYVGRAADANTRRIVSAQVRHANIRWIAPREAVIENFDPSRLNMHLNEQGRIEKVDCY